jgi:4-amino-4-deoxy-L-arabinose transferase-like glycosyltransferase
VATQQRKRKTIVWLALTCIIALYLSSLHHLHPASLFGQYHDDTIYFSTAKALAEGRGYIIPSFPGTPPQSKYPILYPWLLSWIWRWSPTFPANLGPALWLTAALGCVFLLVAFLWMRRTDTVGDVPALILTAICASNLFFLGMSAAVMSDVPFGASALIALMLAEHTMRPHGNVNLAILTGLAAGLATAFRTLGVAVFAGILVVGLLRRAYRQSIGLFLAALPLLAVAFWPTLHHMLTNPFPVASLPTDIGWRQTYGYYTGYLDNWKSSVHNSGDLVRMVRLNGVFLLIAPARYLLSPLVEPVSLASLTLYFVMLTGLISGLLRRVRRQQNTVFFICLVSYSVCLIVWPWGQMGRFLIPFLPLFLVGFWEEASRLMRILGSALAKSRPTGERVVAAAMSAAGAVLAFAILWNLFHAVPEQIRKSSDRRARLLPEKMEAFRWIEQNTEPNARFIAYEDGLLYLYTGRQGSRPIAISPVWFYSNNTRALESDMAHLMDTARHIGARYWLSSADDFGIDPDQQLVSQRTSQLKRVLPALFQSRNHGVEIIDVSCAVHPDDSECKSVRSVLFPYLDARIDR